MYVDVTSYFDRLLVKLTNSIIMILMCIIVDAIINIINGCFYVSCFFFFFFVFVVCVRTANLPETHTKVL